MRLLLTIGLLLPTRLLLNIGLLLPMRLLLTIGLLLPAIELLLPIGLLLPNNCRDYTSGFRRVLSDSYAVSCSQGYAGQLQLLMSLAPPFRQVRRRQLITLRGDPL